MEQLWRLYGRNPRHPDAQLRRLCLLSIFSPLATILLAWLGLRMLKRSLPQELLAKSSVVSDSG